MATYFPQFSCEASCSCGSYTQSPFMACEVHVPFFTIHKTGTNRTLLVGSIKRQAGSNFDFATRRRNPFGVCTFRCWVSHPYKPAVGDTNRVFSWLVFKIVGIVRHHAIQNSAVIATGLITNILVFVSILSAFPWVRKSVYQFQSHTVYFSN